MPRRLISHPRADKSLPLSAAFSGFGARPGDCVGKSLEQLEAAVVLAVVLRRHEFSISQELQGIEPKYVRALTMGNPERLQAKPSDKALARHLALLPMLLQQVRSVF